MYIGTNIAGTADAGDNLGIDTKKLESADEMPRQGKDKMYMLPWSNLSVKKGKVYS
jgi:hypothetical protein